MSEFQTKLHSVPSGVSLSRIVEKAMNGELFRKHTKKEAADHE